MSVEKDYHCEGCGRLVMSYCESKTVDFALEGWQLVMVSLTLLAIGFALGLLIKF